MSEPSNTGFTARAEALEKRMDETSDFVRSRWHSVEEELAARRLQTERELHRRNRTARRGIGIALFLISTAVILFGLTVATNESAPILLMSGAVLVAAVASLIQIVRALWYPMLSSSRNSMRLSSAQSAPLVLALNEFSEPVPDSLLPDIVARSPEAVTVLVADAKEQGFIESRAKGLVLTPAGRAAGEQLRVVAKQLEAEEVGVGEESDAAADIDSEADPPTAAGV